MPFQEVSKMQCRQKLASLVLRDGVSLSEACRELGVSRPTGYLWIRRAQEAGIAKLSCRSRRPNNCPLATPDSVEAELLALKAQRPCWGAKKLVSKLWPGQSPISVRTADRILARHGLTNKGSTRVEPPTRFEMGLPNELWQMDFKGVGTREYAPLSIIDDCSRFCVCFAPLVGLRWNVVYAALWDVFDEFGLPERFLTDNGAPFNSVRSEGPTPLQARLWLLGISTIHGRPRHPQTQGKVERFHLTAEQHIGRTMRRGTIKEATSAMEDFRNDYNWERPHEAIAMKVPGALYIRSARKRPSTQPTHEIPEGAISRKVDVSGKLCYRMKSYRAGKGLAGQYVEIREEENGEGAYFAGIRFGFLQDMKV